MATVHYDRDCRDDYDDSDDVGMLSDPLAVADCNHSDVARAEFDTCGSRRESPRAAPLHRIAEVRQRQGVTLRNVARRLGMPIVTADAVFARKARRKGHAVEVL